MDYALDDDCINEIRSMRIYFHCFRETYLSMEVETSGKKSKCSFCKEIRETTFWGYLLYIII